MFLFSGTQYFRSGKAVEAEGGDVAALRRTTEAEDLRSQSGKVAFH
jgi:hypothetical protein